MSRPAPTVDIVIYPPGEEPIRHTLTGEPFSLGRSADCSLPVRDRFLSRKHTEISFDGTRWLLRDCESANGTYHNGVRLESYTALQPGDSIRIGETEVLFGVSRTDRLFAVDDSGQSSAISLEVADALDERRPSPRTLERALTINELAIELIEERSLGELFDFLIDRVMTLLDPSRAALALMGRDRATFETMKVRRRDQSDTSDLVLSRTLLEEVLERKRAVSILDVGENSRLAQAKSIVAQNIRSAVCAPLVVGNAVLGVLYVDWLVGQKEIVDDDVRLVAQIARFAATKLENTRLREQAVAQKRLDEDLRTAVIVQSRLLPSSPPTIPGWDLAGLSRPARVVSGDYYDFVLLPGGKLYFIIADVSGKGITAALFMSSLAMAFNIFAKNDLPPGELVTQLNAVLSPRLSPAKFVTMVAGVIDPARPGEIRFANAGHVPPLHFGSDGVTEVGETDIVLGLFESSKYREQRVDIAPGDSFVLYTDGIIEAEDHEGEIFGVEGVMSVVGTMRDRSAGAICAAIDRAASGFAGGSAQNDDVTILALHRSGDGNL